MAAVASEYRSGGFRVVWVATAVLGILGAAMGLIAFMALQTSRAPVTVQAEQVDFVSQFCAIGGIILCLPFAALSGLAAIEHVKSGKVAVAAAILAVAPGALALFLRYLGPT
jgi:hypothetical protein